MNDPYLHRRGNSTLRLTDQDGQPLKQQEVVIEQTDHKFSFGCIGFDLIDHANGVVDESELAKDWLELFNLSVLPFYWGQFEPERGKPKTAGLQKAASWFQNHGVKVKGHPLVWHTVKADWLDSLPVDEVEQIVRERVRREVHNFRGLIDDWDAINEVVIMPEFTNEPDGIPNAITKLAQKLGRVDMVRLAIEEARSANPSIRLLLNDFDLSVEYENLIEQVLDADIKLDAIGIQTHMHQGFRGEQILEIADRFSRFKLPLHFTETTILSGDLMPPEIVDLNDYVRESWPSTEEGEARQAEELEQHYKMLFGHPSVESITYWGITDRGAWLGAPVGLVREDGSRKPGFETLKDLIKKQWWQSPTKKVTDENGTLEVNGFYGDYKISSRGAEINFSLPHGQTEISLKLT